jgi:hypothetical protein
MPSRFSVAGALASTIFFAVSASALAAAPTITSPTPGQSYSDPAAIQFAQVEVTVTGPDGWSSSTSPDDDGTWTERRAPNPDMRKGSYTVTACQSGECSAPVSFTFAGASGGGAGAATPEAVSGSFLDLWRHRLKVSVSCAQECDYEGTLEVAPTAASRFLRTSPVIGRFSHGQAPKGTSATIVTPTLSEFFQAWPLFSGPVAVTVRIGSASAAGSLAWPKVPSDRSGKGHGLIRGISGPRSVSLTTASVSYRVRLGGLPGTRYIVAGIDTPGNYLISKATWYMGSHLATGADFRKGGAFTLKMAVAGAPRGVAKARQFAPAAAEVQVGILNKHNSHDRAGQDQARYYIELTK